MLKKSGTIIHKRISLRRVFSIVLIIMLCAASCVFGAANSEEIKAVMLYDRIIKLDGVTQTMKDEDGNRVYPLSYHGTTYLPIRAVSEMLGLGVDWDGANNAVILTSKGTSSPSSTSVPTTTVSMGMKNALNKAQSYLSFSAFSRKGLIEQLEYEGFTHDEAVYGADNVGANWKEQAAKKAKSYLSFSAFSRKGLIEQLEYEGFTHDEAVYGADNVGADWKEQAAKKAKSYLSFSAFSRKGLIEQLEYEGFTHDEAVYGADNVGADWKEQAAKKAKSYLSISSFSRSRLIEQLEYEGFTHEEAVYGVGQNGL